ncbi:MAG: outer membrane protein assembly factor BamC [Gammaproteobacteria bacterium]|nr:outer membrane protein assembly factor BamC [Gammaproteobacteria bacterium]
MLGSPNWRRGAIVIVTALVAACSTTSEPDYHGAETLRPLEVPPDLSAVSAEGGYDLPSSASAAVEAEKTGRAEPMVGNTGSVLPESGIARVVRAGSHRWAVIKRNPESIWVAMRSFVGGVGLSIARENPVTGVMETDWAESRPLVQGKTGFFGSLFGGGASGIRDRFRLRIERGSKGETELFITHLAMEEVTVGGGGPDVVETRWQNRASDPEREAEMLYLFIRFLEVGTLDKSKPEVKETVVVEKSKLGRDKDGYPTIKVSGPLDSAWRKLGIALDRAGLLVQDRNPDKYVYFVQTTETETSGIFSRTTKTVAAYYQVQLVMSGNDGYVVLRDAEGERVNTQEGETLLRRVDQQLKN